MLDEWQPRQFLSSLSDMDAGTFLSTFGGTHFLLVDIEDAPDRLVSGLFHTSPLVRHDTPLMEELTGATDVGVVRETRVARSTRGSQASSLAREILSDNSMRSRFLAPLNRRTGNADRASITVGRNLTNDVILKHQSISRVHASFALAQDGELELTDLDSKNGTSINGVALSGTRRVHNGDTIKFGQIEAVLCDAEVLWQMVHPEVSTLSSPWKR